MAYLGILKGFNKMNKHKQYSLYVQDENEILLRDPGLQYRYWIFSVPGSSRNISRNCAPEFGGGHWIFSPGSCYEILSRSVEDISSF